MKVNELNADEIIERFRLRGVTFMLEGERLGIRAPKGVLSDSDKHLLALNKQLLVEHLSRRREDPRNEFPLTEIQQAYWVGRRAMTLGKVGCHAYRELSSEDIDLPRLEAAWQRLIERHEMMRAVVTREGRQRILADTPRYRIRELDLRGRPDAQPQLTDLRARMSHHAFDPEVWPLFDIRLTRLDGEVRIHIGMDLLIADAASMLQLYREWGALYRNPGLALPTTKHSFADYVQGKLPSPNALARAEAYWRPRLQDLPGAPELPLAKSPDKIDRPRFVRHTHTLGAATWAALCGRGRDAGLTPSNLLVAAYADILATWSKDQRFLITLTAFRAPPEYAQVVGDFTTTLILEADAGAGSFLERARALQYRLLQDLEHDAWSGVRVVRELSRARQQPADPIPVVFTSALGHQSATEGGLPISWLGRTVEAITQTPQVWIDHHAIEDGDALVVSWDLVQELFPSGMDTEMFTAYCGLLEALAADDRAWERPLGAHLPASQIERRARVNATSAPLPAGFLHDAFFARAKREPDRPAVLTPDHSLSYGELAGIARAVARAVGAGRGRLVGIAMKKGWEQAAAALGVVAAGAAYLPIDPALPAARRRFLAENGALDLVLTQGDLLGLDWPEGVATLAVDQLEPGDGPLAPVPGAAPEDLAYVIYTSGSTGKPKGVMVTHRAALNTIEDVNRRFGIGEDDAVLGLSSLSFDLSIYDIFGLLGCGGRLVLPDPGRLRDPGHWLALMDRHGVSVWNTVPALLGMLLEHDRPLGDRLRVAMLSGDWVPLALPGQLRALAPRATLYALGGATEAAIWSNWFRVDEVDPAWRSIPYGWPLANQRYRVLNQALEPCPDGVPGRLFIAGAGLAAGYWRDPKRTAEKFILHPSDGERLYETGDLGRYLPDGAIEFLGREDFQVKVRGHRIELGEIETALRAHPAVGDAVAVAAGQPGGERRLAAYVVPAAPGPRGRAAEEPEGGLELGEVLLDPVERLAFRLGRPALRPVPTEAERVQLPGPTPDPELWHRRRTVRRFDSRPVPLAAFGALLGCLRAWQSPDSGLPKYRYASAGTAYPVQTWVHVKADRVEGLAAGLYYYHPGRHDLEPVAPDLVLPRELHMAGNRPIFDQAAFSLFLVSAGNAIRPLYGRLARDFCLLESGYMGQVLMEEAAGSGLGLCAIGAVHDEMLQKPLLLSTERELVHSFLGGVPTEDEPASGLSAGTHPNPNQELPRVLRAWLADRLPQYMVPDDLIALASLPLTTNGKVDRSRLPEAAPGPSVEPAPLRGELEETIARIFAEVLNVPVLGRDDLVFDLGGTSVHMVRIHRRLEDALERSIDIVDLFRSPSVARLAARLEPHTRASAAGIGSARGAARRTPRRRDRKGQENE